MPSCHPRHRGSAAFVELLTIAVPCLLAAGPTAAAPAGPRNMEALDRGVVAVKVKEGVFVGWRLLGTDPSDVAFHVYRDGKRIEAPADGPTNLLDRNGDAGATYRVHPVVGGVEQPAGGTADAWPSRTLTIPLDRPAGGTTEGRGFSYSPNDIGVGDLDGDGQWELVVKWDPSNSKDNSSSGTTGAVYLDAYELSGKKLWRIDLGPNIRAGAHYTPFLMGDYDGDGRAEVACKTAPGTRDGAGAFLSSGPAAADNDSQDFRGPDGRVLAGPEYLTLFDGRTGRELATADYWPARGKVGDWGDKYGNRVDRFLATNACLDGVKPSMVFQRGYYTRMALAAWDWDGRRLVRRWTSDSPRKGEGGYGEGCHCLAAGDIDGDGRDELVEGSCAIDDDGTVMYRTGLGHGDAMHLGDFDPDNPGLEVWCVHESRKAALGHELHDARTGRILWGRKTGNDNGRGLAADIDGESCGHEMWSASVDGVWSCAGKEVSSRRPSIDFRIYWDGDLLDELLDGTRLDKWKDGRSERLVTLPGSGCNGSKKTPNFAGDLLGDWREEVITHDEENLYLTATTIPTPFRLHTLAHDPVYRLAMSWQNAGYNQPPHLGFWLGAGVDKAPRPAIRVVQAGKESVTDRTLWAAAAVEVRVVSTLAELAAAAAGDDAVVEMPPGTYRLRDFVTPEGIRDRREHKDFAFLRFAGSRNEFRLRGVVIEVDTRLRNELRPPIHTDEFVVDGAGNVIEGLAIVNVGDGTSHGGAAMGVSGTGNTLRDVAVTVRGSAPYGYGDLFGKGGLKHSGIHVTGDGTRLERCRVRMEAFGHGIYLQDDAADVVIEDCEVSGVMRPTDEILAEQSGIARDRDFLMEMQSRAGSNRILPGYRKALAEDAFRTYGEHPGLVIRGCTARDMRGGFELRTRAGPVVEECAALGCERGFWVSDKAVVSRCRADFRHGPALYAERDGARIEIELLPSASEAKVHAAAVIAGKGNRVRLTAADPLGREAPILVGFGPPGMGENMAPFGEPWTAENELVNLTSLPVAVGKRASRDRIETIGPVVENLGRDVTIIRREAAP